MNSKKISAVLVTLFVAVIIVVGVVGVDYYKNNLAVSQQEVTTESAEGSGEVSRQTEEKTNMKSDEISDGIQDLGDAQEQISSNHDSVNTAPEFAGQLKVTGTKLTDEAGNTVVLRGLSSHGLSWYPEYVNEQSIKFMHEKWGMNVFRLAMYTAENGGYCVGDDENKKKLIETVEKGVDAAIENDMYAIIDWHILSDGNPNNYVDQAAIYFDRMSSKYSDVPNVIYEICNEPNGSTSWNDIKQYADRIIPIIRNNSPNAIVIVGTPNWSQYVDDAAASPLDYENVMYSLHFYAGTHKDSLRNTAKKALKKGLPIFVSEFGLTDASGRQGVDVTEGAKWLDFMNENDLSACMWSLSNKDEAAAIIIPNCHKTNGWEYNDLKKQGQWMVDEFMKWDRQDD